MDPTQYLFNFLLADEDLIWLHTSLVDSNNPENSSRVVTIVFKTFKDIQEDIHTILSNLKHISGLVPSCHMPYGFWKYHGKAHEESIVVIGTGTL